MADEKVEEAVRNFEMILRTDPNDVEVMLKLGYSRFHLDDHSEAMRVYDKILDKHKGNINVVYAKARSKAALNEVNEAFDLLNVAIKHSKTIKLWARKEKVFEKFYDDPEFQRMVK